MGLIRGRNVSGTLAADPDGISVMPLMEAVVSFDSEDRVGRGRKPPQVKPEGRDDKEEGAYISEHRASVMTRLQQVQREFGFKFLYSELTASEEGIRKRRRTAAVIARTGSKKKREVKQLCIH